MEASEALTQPWGQTLEKTEMPLPMMISMDPPNPQKGDDYDYKINFVCDVDVTGGDLHFKAYKNGLKIVDKTKDLCEGLADSQTLPHSSCSV